ncbi:hypothetical protein [Dyella psychrodurans]|uniref:Cytochrome c oxidase subunit 2A n=1 Tax=Dyella psychrodurans TaxID=1927960 RepID=A0A370XDJ6_9GAMM|nr:hypothetical protein [Dyella psychrodurans]RDS86340.1 hypothetical protein DWU99_03535 [Dyella psychrodurans]
MTESKSGQQTELTEDERIDQIVREGPRGALVLVSIATVIVVTLWFAFFFLVFLPRGLIQ